MTDHVSDLQWDQLLAGDLSAEAGKAAQTHAARCAACAARLRDLTAERDAFRVRAIRIPGLRRRPRWISVVVPLAAAALALIVLLDRPREDDLGVRVKGSVRMVASAAALESNGIALLLSVGRPDALRRVGDDVVIHPGDYLQVGYTAGRDGFGAVLSRDSAGSVTTYVPFGSDVMVPLLRGSERSFPQSTILDATLGAEQVVVVWCETAHPLGPLLIALRAGQPIPASSDCVTRAVRLEKRAATDSGRGFVRDL